MKTEEQEKPIIDEVEFSRLVAGTTDQFGRRLNFSGKRVIFPNNSDCQIDDLRRLVSEKAQHLRPVIRETLNDKDTWNIFYPDIQLNTENLEKKVDEQFRKAVQELTLESIEILRKKSGYIFLKFCRGKLIHKTAFRFLIVAALSSVTFPLLLVSFFAPSSVLFNLGWIGFFINFALVAWFYAKIKNSLIK